MEAIIFNPSDIKVEDVVKLPNVFLHPTHAANSLEIFAILGTEEQYRKFYADCKSCQCTKIAVKERGGMMNTNLIISIVFMTLSVLNMLVKNKFLIWQSGAMFAFSIVQFAFYMNWIKYN